MNDASYANYARGTACERVVEADLLFRGLRVRIASVDEGHDLFFLPRAGSGYVSVQVKSRDMSKLPRGQSRDSWRAADHSKPVASDVLAIVDPHTRAIEYRPAVASELPFELSSAYKYPGCEV